MSRVAVVTGGASGLGAAICRHLADAGRQVGVLDVNADAAEELAGALRAGGSQATAARVDVSDRTAVDDALAKVRAELGPIEILVTSAAIADFVPFEALTIEAWTQMLTVNLTGTFHCIQAAISDMNASGMPRRSSGTRNVARSEAMTTSQCRARTIPPAMHTPLTFATQSFELRSM